MIRWRFGASSSRNFEPRPQSKTLRCWGRFTEQPSVYKGLKIAVVIPAFREEGRVGQVIRELPAWVDYIVAVDGQSPDDTFGAIQRAGDPRVTALRHEANQGVGGATVTGFNKACALGADIIVKMDGDGQMDPGGLPAMIEPIWSRAADFTK